MTGDNSKNPTTHLGRQMKRDRLGHGWSLRELAARTGINFAHLGRIESGERLPTEKIAMACDAVFPERDGWYARYYEESRDWTPPGLRNWAEYENRSATLRVWSPGVIDGFLQVEAYARELLRIHPGVTEEIITARLASRMERQRRVLHRDDPPSAWFVVDEVALYRYVGSPAIMAGQLSHLADVASLPHVTMTVMPAVAHPGNESEFILTDDAVYVEHVVGGFTYTDAETVTRVGMRFDSLRGESYRVSDSLARIRRMEAIWNRSGQVPTAVAEAVPALKSPRPRV
jgi:transcriptional regulator with XRE-family HTH domain